MILVPLARDLDFKVLEEGIREAKLRGSDITVVHVLSKDATPKEIARGNKLLDNAVSLASKSGVKAIKRLVISDKPIGDCIVELAEKTNSQLIVMGCGIVRSPDGAFLRETTEYVILNSNQNILLVKI